jgi:hypothetical protein
MEQTNYATTILPKAGQTFGTTYSPLAATLRTINLLSPWPSGYGVGLGVMK